ncbi:U3 small nucleolar RNA-associated protein 14 homolog A [Epargyreus clarus]|uniref:U3 small nucleolar RNA-associated protein 14 homolog A n=1 Tax=Epargyreus clarus TaxID=520877 RepID=UPI003C2FCB90
MDDNEDLDFVTSEHDRLINAVKKLDKTQHITAPIRSEPTNLSTEFNLVKRSKLDLLNAAKLLENTASHVQISKKLKATQNKSQVLPKPLEKPQAERIRRETGYVETKKKIGRWDAVVARSRTVDFVSFPLKTLQAKEKDPPTKTFLQKLKLKSPLEKELEEIDPPAVPEEEEDDEKSFPMTYHEMLEHRQHLAKLRAKESYKAAKAKRQSKIKSKKYHRILKKEKLKQQLKEFEELQAKNPEEALKKLEELEKVRALERHTLRHKNTGKWAKNKLVRAKYDKEVRQQLAEQLSVGRSLTHKTQDTASTDDEADDNAGIPDLTLSQDPSNPWMMQSAGKSNIDEEFNFGYKKYLKEKMYKRKEMSDSESDAEDTTGNPQGTNTGDKILEILKNSVNKMSAGITEDEVLATIDKTNKVVEPPKKTKKQNKKQKTSNPVSTTTWVVDSVCDNDSQAKTDEDISEAFEIFENKVAKQVEEKLKKLRKDITNLENKSRTSNKKNPRKRAAPKDNLEYLKLKNQKVKAIIDEPLMETNKDNADEIETETAVKDKIQDLQTVPSGVEKEKTNTDIDPNTFINVKPKYLNTALSKEHDIDNLDDDEQVVPKVDIGEVFEEDDVVASFRQEKEDEINKDKPEIELDLPGWGAWGGKGVKAPKRKRNRFISKPAPEVHRRDENKGDVIIMETKDPKLSVHKVTDVPFPFNSVKDYEASIRAPLGNTFIPERAHKKLIRPSVITKAGTIIDPMDEEELLMPRNKSFHNESVIKLLAKK